MDSNLRVLLIDVHSGFYRMERYPVGHFIGPVDLGLYLSGVHNSLNIGAGLLAGSILPGSNRLFFTGFSPCWGGFYISSMGGAALVFDNLGVNMVSILGRATTPSILILNRSHGEEIKVDIKPIDIHAIWSEGGTYAFIDHSLRIFGDTYENDPRILATGPASSVSDIGGICSIPIVDGKLTAADTWAGRGGLGSKLFQQHGIAGIIYGGTFVDDDFRDREVADQWFTDKYEKRMTVKDFEATTKYRFDERFQTGGTFGVNYATLGGRLLSFNYKSIYMDEHTRMEIHERFIRDHYLKQFNEEIIREKHQKTCGEPCPAVCKKIKDQFKKDYEPYQVMGPLSGIFDHRAAELVNHRADMYGFDAISVGGVIAWLMDCAADNLIELEDLTLTDHPRFDYKGFQVVDDSMHNARIGIQLLDSIIKQRGVLDLSGGARRLAHRLSAQNAEILDKFIFNSFGRNGWMVPNQYWVPGVMSPMAIMGKYYMYYNDEYLPPRELGRRNAERMKKELLLDSLGFCRFHRGWAEDMIPDIIDKLYGKRSEFLEIIASTASRINSRNASVFWESERMIDFVHLFHQRKKDVDGIEDPSLEKWLNDFRKDKHETALCYWYEIHKGIQESLREV